jgi:hypothetical protein
MHNAEFVLPSAVGLRRLQMPTVSHRDTKEVAEADLSNVVANILVVPEASVGICRTRRSGDVRL